MTTPPAATGASSTNGTAKGALAPPAPAVLFALLDYDGDGELVFDDISKYCAESGCNATRAAAQIGGNRTRAAFLLAFDTSRDLAFLLPPAGANAPQPGMNSVNASSTRHDGNDGDKVGENAGTSGTGAATEDSGNT